VYVGGADGNLYALDASNGNKLWNFTLQPLGQVYNGLLCSPAVVDGRVYIGSNTHVMTVLGEASNVTPTSSLTPTASPTKPSTTSFSTELVIAAVAIAIVAIAVMALWLRKRASRKITH
jgi:outer membrane protein assembly factor BamB